MKKAPILLLLACMLPVNGQIYRAGKITTAAGKVMRVQPYSPTPPEWDGNVWYVSVTGDNLDAGSFAAPWKTISYAMGGSSGVAAGDSIYLEAGYYGNEEVIFGISGTLEDKIVIQGWKDWPGDQPKDDWTYGDALDGNEMPLYDLLDRTDKGTVFNFNQKDGITINNIQVTDCQYPAYIDGNHNRIDNWYCTQLGDGLNENYFNSGIWFAGSKHPLGVKEPSGGEIVGYDADSCVANNVVVVNSAGQGFWVWSDYDSITNCEVYCNEYDVFLGTDYYIVLTGNNNYVGDCFVFKDFDWATGRHGGHGIGVKGSWLGHVEPEYSPLDNEGNVVERCTTRNITGEGFWSRHSNVTNNTFLFCHTQTGGQGYKIGDGAHHNYYIDCSADSMLQTGNVRPVVLFSDGSEDAEGETGVSNEIIRMVISNSNAALQFDEDYLGNPSETKDNIFLNWTVYKCSSLFNKMEGINSGNVATNWILFQVDDDYNVLGTTDNMSWNYTTFHQCLFTTPTGVGNITDNPLFVDAPNYDFTLTTVTSPAIDAGLDVGEPFLGLAPDMGAFEKE